MVFCSWMGSVSYLLEACSCCWECFCCVVGCTCVVYRFFLAMRLIKLRIYDYFIIYSTSHPILLPFILHAHDQCTTPAYFYKWNTHITPQHTHNNTMQQLALFDPALAYYCHSCRKPLQHSVRVIAKIADFDCFLDFCPPCLAH